MADYFLTFRGLLSDRRALRKMRQAVRAAMLGDALDVAAAAISRISLSSRESSAAQVLH